MSAAQSTHLNTHASLQGRLKYVFVQAHGIASLSSGAMRENQKLLTACHRREECLASMADPVKQKTKSFDQMPGAWLALV